MPGVRACRQGTITRLSPQKKQLNSRKAIGLLQPSFAPPPHTDAAMHSLSANVHPKTTALPPKIPPHAERSGTFTNRGIELLKDLSLNTKKGLSVPHCVGQSGLLTCPEGRQGRRVIVKDEGRMRKK